MATPASELWNIAKEQPEVFKSKGYMKMLLFEMRRRSLVKAVPLGEHYGYELSGHYRHEQAKRRKLAQKETEKEH